MVGNLDDQARQHQVLLDLFERGLGDALLPVGDVCLGDYRSCSSSVLAVMRQRGFRRPGPPLGERAR